MVFISNFHYERIYISLTNEENQLFSASCSIPINDQGLRQIYNILHQFAKFQKETKRQILY